MKICNDHYSPIVFERRYQGRSMDCPLCRANAHIEEMEKEIGELKSEIFELKVERANGKPGRENAILSQIKIGQDTNFPESWYWNR